MTPEPTSAEVAVSISIDTEEDNWGAYVQHGATSRNIAHLRDVQDVFDRWGAKPTYLVNYVPLLDGESVAVLGELAARESVEIGAHCHPWNTPPYTGEGEHRSMMNGLTFEENRALIATVANRIGSELGVTPRSFRAGRWGFGPTVARALVEEGFEADCSVSPFIDWSPRGGPDYSQAPYRPYRLSVSEPLVPVGDGDLVELPTTVGFLGGRHRASNRIRRRLEGSWLARLKGVGLADRAGLLTRRWLSPELASGDEMVRLVEAFARSGVSFLQITFHSCTLLPGVTPFVHDEDDRGRIISALDRVLGHCERSGFVFRKLIDVARDLRRDVAYPERP